MYSEPHEVQNTQAQSMNIPLDSLGEPFYQGSVQRLYAVDGRDDLMVSETTAVGSVFDVGAIFSIEGSDVSRAVFRHALYSSMAKPETWAAVKDAIEADSELDPEVKRQLLEGVLEDCVKNGAKTHHGGMVDAQSGEVVTAGAPENPSTFNVVRRYQIIKPPQVRLFNNHMFDYSEYPSVDGNVIPLECIVRFGVTSGSSVFRKYGAMNEKEKKAFEAELGVPEPLEAWKMVKSPILDFTSKYEPEDRAVSKQEAMLMSGVDAATFLNIGKMAVLGAWVVRNLVESMGLNLWDIKWEFAKDGDDLVFVDTIDTDSIRATGMLDHNGDRFIVHVNKQAMRDYYKIAHSEWLAGINEAKSESKSKGVPFVDILRAGQEEGRWVADPEVHEEFLKIQTDKMNLVKDGILGNQESAAVKTGLDECGRAEIAFYEGLGKLNELKELNCISS